MYDILIPTASKDFLKFRFLYDSIQKNLTGFDKIHCISNIEVPEDLVISGVQYYLDDDILDFDFSKFTGICKERKRWYIQQFVKLFQQVTADDYLVVDADLYFNRKIDIYENGKPTFLFGLDQNNTSYFQFTREMLNFGRVHPYSFISEAMLFKRELINHMVASTGLSLQKFVKKAIQVLNKINNASGMCEYETYGNYVTKHFKDQYNYKHIKTKRGSKHRIWEVYEIQEFIDSVGPEFDTITYHSWITEK